MADIEKNGGEKSSSGIDIKIIAIGLVFFLAVVGVTVLVMNYFVNKMNPQPKEEEAVVEVTEGQILKVPEITTNVQDIKGSRYLKAVIQLEFEDAAAAEEAKVTTLPIIQDTILGILKSKKVEDLNDTEPIKKEILESLNKRLGGEKIKSVLITDWIIQ